MTIYRQLAGGVTAAQLLHGSANPIGGQSQIIKLRWGADAAGLKFAAAPGTIKFALGENVKQANWGDNFTKRYPQTRMQWAAHLAGLALGVERIGGCQRVEVQLDHALEQGPRRIDLSDAIQVLLDDGVRCEFTDGHTLLQIRNAQLFQ